MSATLKVLKSCKSKMATLAHDVCDAHEASSFYIKTCWQYLHRVFLTGGMGESPTNQKFAHSPPPHQTFLPSHQNSIQPNKNIKTSIFAVVIAPVPFLF